MFDFYQEPTEITLHASDLAEKRGFDDGDLYKYDRDELIKLVEHFLLPKLPATIETYTLVTCHNPIRCKDEYKGYCKTCGISVTVSVEDVDQFLSTI